MLKAQGAVGDLIDLNLFVLHLQHLILEILIWHLIWLLEYTVVMHWKVKNICEPDMNKWLTWIMF